MPLQEDNQAGKVSWNHHCRIKWLFGFKRKSVKNKSLQLVLCLTLTWDPYFHVTQGKKVWNPSLVGDKEDDLTPPGLVCVWWVGGEGGWWGQGGRDGRSWGQSGPRDVPNWGRCWRARVWPGQSQSLRPLLQMASVSLTPAITPGSHVSPPPCPTPLVSPGTSLLLPGAGSSERHTM